MDMSGRRMSVVLVLVLSVVGTQGECTNQELDLLFECITPYNAKFYQEIGQGSSCNRSHISNDICTDFRSIVTCVNSKSVSRTTCRPFAVGQIDPNIGIPCKINDFENVCKNAPAIDKGATGAAETASVHTSLTLMTGFVTVVLVTLM